MSQSRSNSEPTFYQKFTEATEMLEEIRKARPVAAKWQHSPPIGDVIHDLLLRIAPDAINR